MDCYIVFSRMSRNARFLVSKWYLIFTRLEKHIRPCSGRNSLFVEGTGSVHFGSSPLNIPVCVSCPYQQQCILGALHWTYQSASVVPWTYQSASVVPWTYQSASVVPWTYQCASLVPTSWLASAVSRHVERPVLIEPAFIVLKQLASRIY